MSTSLRRLALGSVTALAVVVAGVAVMPAEAATKKFKASFALKLPGEPKGASSFKAAVSGPIGQGTGFIYQDGTGAVTLNGVGGKAGLTTTLVQMNVNVFGGMDLTGVTFPVSRPALLVLSYSKTTIKLSDPTHPKIIAYNYSSDTNGGVTLTVNSYDPVAGTMTGTLTGTVVYHENAQDPTDDARDGKVVTLNNAKFALKSLQP
jgi:hypothetical protein